MGRQPVVLTKSLDVALTGSRQVASQWTALQTISRKENRFWKTISRYWNRERYPCVSHTKCLYSSQILRS